MNIYNNDFNNLLKKKFYDFKKNFNLCENLQITEKILLVELLTSEKLFAKVHLKFNYSTAFEEILRIDHEIIKLVETNHIFFYSMSKEIEKIINNRKFRTKFKIFDNDFDHIIYLTIILKAMHVLEKEHLVEIINSNPKDPGMIHRSIVFTNLNKLVFPYKLLISEIKELEINCIKIMILLASSKNNNEREFIIKKKISTLINKKKKEYKTDIYLKFNIISSFSYLERINILYSRIPFKLVRENFFIGASHLTISAVSKKSIKQEYPNYFDPSSLEKLSSREIYIDFSYWKEIKKVILNNFNSKYNINKNLFVSNFGIDVLITELLNLKEEFRIKTLEKAASLGISQEKEKNNLFKEYYLFANKIESDLQRLFEILVIEKAKKIRFPIYMPHYYDFRGRIYPRSLLGFIFVKTIRPLFKIRTHLDKESLIQSKYYEKVILISQKINFPYEFNIKNNLDRYFLIVLFLDLGQLKKKELISSKGISAEDLINKGIEIFTDKDVNFNDPADQAKFLLIKSCLENFINTEQWDNILINRDSTASSLQHWAILLEPKPNFFSKLNLEGDLMFDLYTTAIELFLKKFPEYKNNKELDHALKRKYLKQVIMTVNYNSTVWRCYHYFKKSLSEDKILNESINYWNLIEDFHKFLNEDLFTEIYIYDKNKFLDKIKNENFIFKDKKNIPVSLIYYKSRTKYLIVKIDQKRWKFSLQKLIKEIDELKSSRALPANLIQSLDAELAAYLSQNMNCWPVHDSFGVSLFEVHLLMDLTNSFFKKKFKEKKYSFFILT